MKPLGHLFDIVPAFRPVDLMTAANSGDYISLKNAQGVLILFHSTIGTAGDDPTITVRQATTVAGGSVKDLAVVTEIFTKQAATDLTTIAGWTKVTQAAAATYTEATSAEQEALWAIQIEADQLDVDGGFDCIAANVADVGANAQLGACYYILYGLRHQATPENLPSSIV